MLPRRDKLAIEAARLQVVLEVGGQQRHQRVGKLLRDGELGHGSCCSSLAAASVTKIRRRGSEICSTSARNRSARAKRERTCNSSRA
jgi:hypothetical protein